MVDVEAADSGRVLLGGFGLAGCRVVRKRGRWFGGMRPGHTARQEKRQAQAQQAARGDNNVAKSPGTIVDFDSPPGSQRVLPLSSPLRTGREGFPSSGSSP